MKNFVRSCLVIIALGTCAWGASDGNAWNLTFRKFSTDDMVFGYEYCSVASLFSVNVTSPIQAVIVDVCPINWEINICRTSISIKGEERVLSDFRNFVRGDQFDGVMSVSDYYRDEKPEQYTGMYTDCSIPLWYLKGFNAVFDWLKEHKVGEIELRSLKGTLLHYQQAPVRSKVFGSSILTALQIAPK